MPKFIKTIKIVSNDEDGRSMEEELEIWRLSPNGILVGIDSSYLENVNDWTICPYTGKPVHFPQEEIDKVRFANCDERDILGF